MRDPLLRHDLVAMAAPVTKWSVQVEHADEMARIMQRAFKIANEHPKGPVFVALPIDVMEQETDNLATTAGELIIAGQTDDNAIQQLADRINNSTSIGIIAGDDVAQGGATDALVKLAEKTGAGVHLELVCGELAFPTQHPQCLGRMGGDAAGLRRILGEYDLVLMIGGRFFEDIWFADGSPFPDNCTVVQLEAGPSRLAHNHPLTLGISADIRLVLEGTLSQVDEKAEFRARRELLNDRHNDAETAYAEQFEALKHQTPMTPARAIRALSEAITEDVVIVEEAITASNEVIRYFDRPGSLAFYRCRGGGIGQGMAGCIGTAVAHPDDRVLAFTGDGSAMYSNQSLWSAAHHNLKIIFIIMSNREYRVLKQNADQYRTRFDSPSNKPYPHMDLNNPHLGFVEMAASMGVPGRQITDPGDIADAVNEAFSIDGPYLIDLVVEGLEARTEP